MFVLWGGDGSPYSCKLRALLRYRRIPFIWKSVTENSMGIDWESQFPELRGRVIPVLVRPDGTYANDSTPLIRELDSTIPSRRCFPTDPAMAFISALIEDFADEWCTKPMFAGRFFTEKDATFGAAWQILSAAHIAQIEGAETAAAEFAARQRSRQGLVGSKDWAVMEHTIRQVCEAVEANLRSGKQFLLGASPTNADFALFGQMRQWAADPRPALVMHEYPGAWGWTWRMDDLSGLPEPQMDSVQFAEGARRLIGLASETYIPFMQANLLAVEAGQKEVAVKLLPGQGREVVHKQPVFKYQAACWLELQQMYGSLSENSKTHAIGMLQSAGVDNPFATLSKL